MYLFEERDEREVLYVDYGVEGEVEELEEEADDAKEEDDDEDDGDEDKEKDAPELSTGEEDEEMY
ncbi:MAG: hypothetical protein Q8P35_00085 [Candidatus Yanofskybacteria bacterium]|nr:hypothetical protein [Candidatus Yanofskybacteria bacterium]